MDKTQFVKRLESINDTIDKKWISKVLNTSIDCNLHDGNPRGHHNLIIVMEELAELSKEISKQLRGKGDNINILEELADVQIGIYYVQNICNISSDMLNKAINVKTERLEKVLNETGIFK